MAAPFFYNTQVLLQDLKTLGYPNVHDVSCVSYNGQKRIQTLQWLAIQIDPTYNESESTPAKLAAFWDQHGIHSSPPNTQGYRIPFNCTGDKIRERNAANMFLRSCIDLTMAFQRIRAANPDSLRWINQKTDQQNEQDEKDEETDDEMGDGMSNVLSDYDCEAMQQLDMLINNRHKIFPSTLKFVEQTEKKKPFAPRKVPNGNSVNNKNSCIPGKRKPKVVKDKNQLLKSRHEYQERLRILEKETDNMVIHDHTNQQLDSNSDDDRDYRERTESIKQLGSELSHLCKVVDQIKVETHDLVETRKLKQDLELDNSEEEEKNTKLVVDCHRLGEQVQTTISSLQDANNSLQQIQRDCQVSQQIAQSKMLQNIVEQKSMTERRVQW